MKFSAEEFANLSYRAQINRLRLLALKALELYPLDVISLKFINHGENTTFKVITNKGDFLLRIHRANYHTDAAIQEELRWLKELSQKTKLLVPIPILSKNGKHLEKVSNKNFAEGRNVALLKWTNGKFVWKSVNEKLMYDLGSLIRRLQENRPKWRVKHRRYWDAEGLVGKYAKFGSIHSLQGVKARDQKIINSTRMKVFARLKKYQSQNPNRMGLIHADMHFGNFFTTQDGLAAIDFDDCGYGFDLYDLAIPLKSLKAIVKENKKLNYLSLKSSLIKGYSGDRIWSKEDDKVLNSLTIARTISMLGWFNNRLDNPRLKKYFPNAVRGAISEIRRANATI